ncbi:unnamed protein product [Urochloa humidicola]
MPISGDTVDNEGQEGGSLPPSRKQIALPFWSLARGSPSKPQSRKLQRLTGVSQASSSNYVSSRLLESMGATTSPPQLPPWCPWASPPQLARGRGSIRRQAPNSSRRHINPDQLMYSGPVMKLTPRKKAPICPVAMPTASAKKRKIEAATQFQPSVITCMPISTEEEDVTQGELSKEQSGSDSSTCSSPIREPQAPLIPIWTSSTGKVYYGLTSDRVALDSYYQDCDKYKEKQARQDQLPILKTSLTVSSIMESYSPKQKEVLLDASKSILSPSAYVDYKEINRCTGIVVEWNEENRWGIVLTSACLITTKKPFSDWSDKEYAFGAKVLVHLLDGSSVNSNLLYFSKHYDLAFYEVCGDLNLKILPLEANLEYGHDLCLLARDMKMNLICNAVNVKYIDPCEHQYNHYLFINYSPIPKCGSGGALANLNGKVVGMLFCTLPLTAFIPSSLILRCAELLRKFGRVVRPQLGLKLRTVGFLDVSRIEYLSRTCGVTSGLIIGEVSAECVAERLGIRAGDVILSCQGESVSSVTQLEEILLGIGGEHLAKSNDSSLKADVEVEVFHVRKGIRRIIHLNVELSGENEIFRSV